LIIPIATIAMPVINMQESVAAQEALSPTEDEAEPAEAMAREAEARRSALR
jgi:hypothetical protein